MYDDYEIFEAPVETVCVLPSSRRVVTEKKLRSKESISSLLEGMKYQDDIKVLACKIFDDLKINTPKASQKNKAIFYCLYVACKELYPYDYNAYEIGEQMGLTKAEMSNAITRYCNVGQNIKTRGYTEPVSAIRSTGNTLGFSEERIEHMLEEWRKLQQYDPSLSESVTGFIVAAFVWLYCSSRYTEYKIDDITAIFRLKPAQIKLSITKLCQLMKQISNGE